MKLFTQAWYQRMAAIFGMNIASVEYVDNAIEESGGGDGNGRVLDEWRPETVAGPAAFSQVAEGYGEAAISNGGKTLTAAGGGLASTAPTEIPMDVEVGIALTMSEITDEGGAYCVFSSATAIDPSANLLAVMVIVDENGDKFCQIVNPFTEEGTTPVPITVTAESKLAFTILRETESTTVRFFTENDFAAPFAEYTFADVGLIDRFGIYAASDEVVEYNLIDGVAAGFTYTPMMGENEIATYPSDCEGRAYELLLAEPAQSAIGLLKNKDKVVFDLSGNLAGYIVTPEDKYLSLETGDQRYKPFVKDNLDAYGQPNNYDDETQGYSKGSKWYNNNYSPAEIYICTNDSEGYAQWQLIPSGDISGFGTMAYQEAGTGANQFRHNAAQDARFIEKSSGRLSPVVRVIGEHGDTTMPMDPQGSFTHNGIVRRDSSGNIFLPSSFNLPASNEAVSTNKLDNLYRRPSKIVMAAGGWSTSIVDKKGYVKTANGSASAGFDFIFQANVYSHLMTKDIDIEITNLIQNERPLIIGIEASSDGEGARITDTYIVPHGKTCRIVGDTSGTYPHYSNLRALLYDTPVLNEVPSVPRRAHYVEWGSSAVTFNFTLLLSVINNSSDTTYLDMSTQYTFLDRLRVVKDGVYISVINNDTTRLTSSHIAYFAPLQMMLNFTRVATRSWDVELIINDTSYGTASNILLAPNDVSPTPLWVGSNNVGEEMSYYPVTTMKIVKGLFSEFSEADAVSGADLIYDGTV